MEGHGRSFPDTRLTFQEKSYVWVGCWVACRIILSAPVPVLSSGLWISDLGLGFGTVLGLDNKFGPLFRQLGKTFPRGIGTFIAPSSLRVDYKLFQPF